MSEKTRAALKVFGINATKLEEAVQRLEKELDKPSAENFIESSKQLNISLVEILGLILELHERGFQAIVKTLHENPKHL